MNDVFECLLVYSLDHSFKILEVIQEIFEDIPNFDNVTDFFALLGAEHLDHSSNEQATDYFDLPDDDIDGFAYTGD